MEKVMLLATVASALAFPATNCTTPYECWLLATQAAEEAKQSYDQATQLINGKINATDARVSVLEASSVGELKIFHTDACPTGWTEMESLKGYLLMGRPKNGTTGTVVNSPLSKDEKSRVGPHGHDATVTDNGHGHGITDPAHDHGNHGGNHGAGGHSFGSWYNVNLNDPGYRTQKSTTGISINSAKSSIDVAVQATTAEGYPLAYVLLCQRLSPSRTSTASPASPNGCPGGSPSACVHLCPADSAIFTTCVEMCSARCSSKAATAAQK